MSGTKKLAETIKKMVREDRQNEPEGYTTAAEVLRVDGSTAWVHIPGPVAETPVQLTMNAKAGDNVQVRVSGGKAWITGNETAPPTDDGTAQQAMTKIAEAEVVIAKKANISDLQATRAKIGELEADTAKIHDLTAEELTATVGYIGELTTQSVTTEDLAAASGYIGDLEAESITAQDISAATGYVGDLTAGNVTAQNLIADHGTVGSLNSNYARINAANITESATQNAWINQLLVQTGLLAHSGTIYTLDAIQVNASNITAGTIDVERLIVTVNNEKYLVHIDPTTQQPTYEKLDGDVIEDLTITADKIVAGAITADKITTNNLVGTNGWINLHSGTFFYGDGADWASCTQGIKWDGSSLLIKGALTVTSGSNVYTKAEADQMNLDASKVATNYLTFDSTNGLDVGASGLSSKVNIKSDGVRIYDGSGNLGNYVSANGMEVYKGGNSVASFGDSVRIGEDTSGKLRTEIKPAGMGIVRKTSGGDVALANIGYGSGTAASGTADAPYFTFGERSSGSTIGNYSMAEGLNVTARGYTSHAEGQGTTSSGGESHAEGYSTTASGTGSHAEGYNTTASGLYSHAEGQSTTASGDRSHAEGQSTTASGAHSHAEGYNTTASGVYSHAGGLGTIASQYYQTAIGQYNVNNTSASTGDTWKLFIIGNGTSSSRSDAFNVAQNGNVRMALDTSATSGVDKDLYAAINALDWASSVID